MDLEKVQPDADNGRVGGVKRRLRQFLEAVGATVLRGDRQLASPHIVYVQDRSVRRADDNVLTGGRKPIGVAVEATRRDTGGSG